MCECVYQETGKKAEEIVFEDGAPSEEPYCDYIVVTAAKQWAASLRGRELAYNSSAPVLMIILFSPIFNPPPPPSCPRIRSAGTEKEL